MIAFYINYVAGDVTEHSTTKMSQEMERVEPVEATEENVDDSEWHQNLRPIVLTAVIITTVFNQSIHIE
jgi:hypothetical protein